MSLGLETKEEAWKVLGKDSSISSQRNELIASAFCPPIYSYKYVTSLCFPSRLSAASLKFPVSAGMCVPRLAQSSLTMDAVRASSGVPDSRIISLSYKRNLLRVTDSI